MTTLTAGLDATELAAYRRDGFVVPRFRFEGAQLARLQALSRRLVADNPGLGDKVMNSPHVPGSGGQGLKSSDGWQEFVAHPAVLDMVEQILGPDIILWGTNLFYKRPEKGPATAWHRDAVNNTIIKPLATTVVWIAVTDSRLENSCLRCIPGSHRKRELGSHIQTQRADLSFGTILDPAEYDETTARDIELDAGQMVLFDVFTIHGARHNLGTIERTGFAMRYMPATSHYDHDSAPDYSRNTPEFGHDTRPLMLVRGVDRCGRNDFKRGHPRRD
jgi:hypothetical protein